MNKRIKDIMSKTLDEKFAGTWSTMDMQDLAKFAEKFAELIVEECAKRAEVYAYMSPNFNALAEELRSMIGVEE